MKISKNLSLREVTKSNTAIRHAIDNTPTEQHLINLRYLAEKVFQPLRDHAGSAIYINSGYRSEALNKKVNGSKTSHHCHGMAIDIDQDDKNHKFTNVDVFYYIKDNLPFTQLIWEAGDETSPAWVHVALQKGREDRKKITIYEIIDGEKVYRDWDRD